MLDIRHSRHIYLGEKKPGTTESIILHAISGGNTHTHTQKIL